MRNTIFFSVVVFILSISLSSCDNEDKKPSNDEFLGTWKLTIVYSGGLTDSLKVTKGDEVPYELYEFNSDNTFTKYRSNGLKASGTYSNSTIDNEDYIVASFTNSEMSFSCIDTQKEYLKLNYLIRCDNNALTKGNLSNLVSDNSPCDGPILFYTKVKPLPID